MSANIARVNREAQLLEDSNYKGKKTMNPSLSYMSPYIWSPNIPEKAEQDKVTYSHFPHTPEALQESGIHWHCVKQPLLADGTVGKVHTGMDSMYLELQIF